MAQGLINKNTLNDIAESIIAKDGGEAMTPSEMATRIDNLPTGGSLNILSAEDLTGYCAASNPTTADYIDYDEMSTSGRTFITETKNHTTPFTMSNSRMAECFNPVQHPKEGVVVGYLNGGAPGYYRAYVGSVNGSSIGIDIYSEAGTLMGTITRNFTTSSSFGTTDCYCSVGIMNALLICFTNGNALCITLQVQPNANPKVIVFKYAEISNFGTFTKKDLFGGASYYPSGGVSVFEIGSTGKGISPSTGEVVPIPTGVTPYYSVAPFNRLSLQSGVVLKTHVGLCCGKIIPIDSSKTVYDLTNYRALPVFAKDFYTVDNKATFINLEPAYIIAFTNIAKTQYNANTKQIDYTQLTPMLDYHLYDIDNEVIVNEIHGWVYNSNTSQYEKNGSSVGLKGLLFDGHIIVQDNMSLVPVIYDEELDSFIKYQDRAASADNLLIYDNFVLYGVKNTLGLNYNSYGEITALQPVLNAKYIDSGIINLEVE